MILVGNKADLEHQRAVSAIIAWNSVQILQLEVAVIIEFCAFFILLFICEIFSSTSFIASCCFVVTKRACSIADCTVTFFQGLKLT